MEEKEIGVAENDTLDVAETIKETTEQIDRVGNAIDTAAEQLPDKDSEMLKDLGVRLGRIKMNSIIRKKLAKKLNVDEKKALNWKIVCDVFETIDTCRYAMEYEHEVAGIVRTIMAIVSIFVLVTIPLSIKLSKMEDKDIAKIVMYAGALTPEHIMSKISEAKIQELEMTEDEALEYYNAHKDDKKNEFKKQLEDMEQRQLVQASPVVEAQDVLVEVQNEA